MEKKEGPHICTPKGKEGGPAAWGAKKKFVHQRENTLPAITRRVCKKRCPKLPKGREKKKGG